MSASGGLRPLTARPLLVGLLGQVSGVAGFVALIETLKHGQSCRVKTVDLSGRTSAYTVRTDHNYWRSYEVFRKDGRWVQRVLSEPGGEGEHA